MMDCVCSENEVLSNAIAVYDKIACDYIDQLKATGITFAELDDGRSERTVLLRRLQSKGARVRNGCASVVKGYLSPGCVACTGSCVSRTFAVTNNCHRDCYFCFNPNEENFAYYCEHDFPWRENLAALAKECDESEVHAIALSGGEPLLRFRESVAFFSQARELFPSAHLRMYTSGDLLTEEMLLAFRDSGLDEIRFSVKQEDGQELLEKVFCAIGLACNIIPSVMVEMPVIPGTEKQMRDLVVRLDSLGVQAINLLEFTYAMWNWEAFEARGFQLKNPPFEVAYDYTYAGSLAVQGSEELCLSLMEWAIDEEISMGMHYCSLENKHRAQLRNENEPYASAHPCYVFDYDDYFLKTATVFGQDCSFALDALRRAGVRDFMQDDQGESLSFSPRWLAVVEGLKRDDGEEVQPCISYNVIVRNAGSLFFRELKVGLASEERPVRFYDTTAKEDCAAAQEK